MTENNIAYIDGQNLFMGTSKCSKCAKELKINIAKIKVSDCICGQAWSINFKRFRRYLEEKYKISSAYYYLGYVIDSESTQRLYEVIQSAGFILKFREHNSFMVGKKKREC